MHGRWLARAEAKMDMYSLGDNRLATFRADHDRIEHLSASLVLMKHRTAARADHVDLPPAPNRHDDRTEVEALFRQDVLWGILIRKFGSALPEAHHLLRPLGKEVARDTKLGLKSFKSSFFGESAHAKSKRVSEGRSSPSHAPGSRSPLQEISILSITPTNCSFAGETSGANFGTDQPCIYFGAITS
jgi:hypothetical protein